MRAEDVEDAVVVGIDTGDQDRALLGWAAEEAVTRKAPPPACHLREWSDTHHPPQLLTEEPAAEPTAAEQRLRAAADTAWSWNPGSRRRPAALGLGNPVPPLLRLSERARMLVVGSRGSGGFAGLRLGSVSVHLAAHARCPVAVVRPPSAVGATDVVVGVDGWPDAELPVRLAAEEAGRLGGKLILVHSYRLPPPAEYGPNAGNPRTAPPGGGRGRRGPGCGGAAHGRGGFGYRAAGGARRRCARAAGGRRPCRRAGRRSTGDRRLRRSPARLGEPASAPVCTVHGGRRTLNHARPERLHVAPSGGRRAGLLHPRGPRGGGRAGRRKLAGCVDLEPLVRTPTGRRSPGSGSRRR